MVRLRPALAGAGWQDGKLTGCLPRPKAQVRPFSGDRSGWPKGLSGIRSSDPPIEGDNYTCVVERLVGRAGLEAAELGNDRLS